MMNVILSDRRRQTEYWRDWSSDVCSSDLNEPEKTAEVIDRARWMHTGDLAVMDAEGYVNIVGRIKEMVIRGGENGYPREVEEFLFTHPDVIEAQVIGVPDERFGEELMAWVRPRERAEIGRAVGTERG